MRRKWCEGGRGECKCFSVPISRSSCPASCRASTSCFLSATKTWMAGTSPAMTRRRRHTFFNASPLLPRQHPLIRRLQSLPDARPRFPAALHDRNGPPSDSNNHEFSADVSVWRSFVRRPMGSRSGGEDSLDRRPAGFMRQTEAQRHELLLSLGNCRHRRAHDLRRHRRDVLAGGVSRADVGEHRLVACRHIERDDA